MYNKENLFAKILRNEIPCEKKYENEHAIAFNDKFPKANIHILVIPKGEYIDFYDFTSNASNNEIIKFYSLMKKIICDKNIDKSGYRIVSNAGVDGRQEIAHFHMHILGGETLT
jgi:histidine triad (HIT) family protein